MIDIKEIEQLVAEKTEGTEVFLVEAKVGSANAISVFIDSPEGISIGQCVELSKFIEEQYDRDVEDFSLEVSSAGIGLPFRVVQQYHKALNKTVEVLFVDGKKVEGKIIRVNADGFEIEFSVKEKLEGDKRPKLVVKQQLITFDEVKATKEIIVV